jgi:hypothetical protein
LTYWDDIPDPTTPEEFGEWLRRMAYDAEPNPLYGRGHREWHVPMRLAYAKAYEQWLQVKAKEPTP